MFESCRIPRSRGTPSSRAKPFTFWPPTLLLKTTHFRHLVQVDPGNADAFHFLGLSYLKLEQFSEARDAFVQLVSLRGTFDDLSALARTQASLSVLNDSDAEAAAAQKSLEAARELAPMPEDFARLEVTIQEILELN